MNKIIIGFTGRQGVGKTTLAKQFQTDLDANVNVLSFAAPMKEALSHMTGIPLSDFYDAEKKKSIVPHTDITLRQLMQKFGTNFVRDTIAPNYWVDRMRATIEKCSYAIVDDVRFEDEANLIREMGGTVICLTRNDPPRTDLHKSENGVKADLTFELVGPPEICCGILSAHSVLNYPTKNGQ